MDILRVKKAHIPPTTIPRKSRITSAPSVSSETENIHRKATSNTVHDVSNLGTSIISNALIKDQDNKGDKRIGEVSWSECECSSTSEVSNSSDD